jgi:hypothetical protein
MEGEEVIYKIIALCIVVFLMVVCESLMITAKRADERAERMYEEWRRKRG